MIDNASAEQEVDLRRIRVETQHILNEHLMMAARIDELHAKVSSLEHSMQRLRDSVLEDMEVIENLIVRNTKIKRRDLKGK